MYINVSLTDYEWRQVVTAIRHYETHARELQIQSIATNYHNLATVITDQAQLA